MYHLPVLLNESVDGLAIHADGTYVDVTFGGGGHSKEIMSRLGEGGRLFGFDQDPDAVANALDDARFQLIQQNFRHLKNNLRFYKAVPVDGVLADLGVSSHQFDVPERGFSTRFDAELDMRMNTRQGITAKEILNEYSEEDLLNIIRLYGELKPAYKVVQAILKARALAPIERIDDLKKAVMPCLNRMKENQQLAQLFQALRIEVNQEMEVLQDFLEQLTTTVKPGGRVSIISYHSLEDRMVKNFLKTGNIKGKLEKDFFGKIIRPFDPVNNKVIIASDEEIAQNSRARSAKLRVATRNEENGEK